MALTAITTQSRAQEKPLLFGSPNEQSLKILQAAIRTFLALKECQLYTELTLLAKPYFEGKEVGEKAIGCQTPVILLSAVVIKFTSSHQFRLSKLQQARAICIQKHWTHLVPPEACISHQCLIERRLPILDSVEEMIHFYRTHQKECEQAIIEFTRFCCEHDLNDLAVPLLERFQKLGKIMMGKYFNVPLFQDSKEHYQIGLIDLETFEPRNKPKNHQELTQSLQNVVRLYPFHLHTIMQIGQEYSDSIHLQHGWEGLLGCYENVEEILNDYRDTWPASDCLILDNIILEAIQKPVKITPKIAGILKIILSHQDDLDRNAMLRKTQQEALVAFNLSDKHANFLEKHQITLKNADKPVTITQARIDALKIAIRKQLLAAHQAGEFKGMLGDAYEAALSEFQELKFPTVLSILLDFINQCLQKQKKTIPSLVKLREYRTIIEQLGGRMHDLYDQIKHLEFNHTLSRGYISHWLAEIFFEAMVGHEIAFYDTQDQSLLYILC